MFTSKVISLAALVSLLVSCYAGAAVDGKNLYEHGAGGGLPGCSTCHGPGAMGGGGGQFPALAGLPAAYVVTQLEAFANGKRSSAVMAPFARGLSSEQREALGQYLATLKPDYPAAPSVSAAAIASGQALVTIGDESQRIPACVTCHGPTLLGGGPHIPPLVGQTRQYLLSQLNAFHDGSRRDEPNLMGAAVSDLTADQMQSAASYIASLRSGQRPEIPRDKPSGWKPIAQSPDSFSPPPEQAMPTDGDYGKMLRFGEQIFDDTPEYAGQYVGNRMSCRNCHLARGRDTHSAPLWAAVPRYPMYRSKNKRVNTFVMRIQGCFTYSENGKAPPADSRVMVGLLTYAHWLATGLPIGIKPKAAGYPPIAKPARTPSRERGAAVFSAKCALCHGDDGQGIYAHGKGDKHETIFPALWGPDSFNWGAGMHRVNTAAQFIKAAMPFGLGGSLSDQDAWDVAAFVDSHPRPQDPRFKGDAEATRNAFHGKHAYGFYGRVVDGKLLGGKTQ